MESVKQTLRQAVQYAKLTKNERILREAGFLNENGTPTEVGRRIIADTLWESDKALQAKVTAAIVKTLPKGKKKDLDDEE